MCFYQWPWGHALLLPALSCIFLASRLGVGALHVGYPMDIWGCKDLPAKSAEVVPIRMSRVVVCIEALKSWSKPEQMMQVHGKSNGQLPFQATCMAGLGRKCLEFGARHQWVDSWRLCKDQLACSKREYGFTYW